MKNKIIYSLVLIICLVLSTVIPICAVVSEDTAYNWYCVRNKDHKQPAADKNMQLVEKYDGYYIDHSHGDLCDDKVIYLTFDVGYENGNVEKILNTMKSENVPGAFFVLKNVIQKNPDIVMRMLNEGHTVCNHSANHPDMTKLDSFEEFKSEMENLEYVYRNLTGEEISKYYRPPEGRFDERSLKYAQNMGYKTIFWSFAYADWDNSKQPDLQYAKAKILDNVHNGAIILLHPTSETNAIILGDIIKSLKSQGYRFGTLDELTEPK